MATSNEIFGLHAEVCKTLSHPKRLEILSILRDDEMAAGDIVNKMKISKANVSQHLTLMRNAGILEARRDGVNIYYRISSPKVIQACDLMREVLMDNHTKKEKLFRKAG
ncbi:MAG: winged helix-turn-helix transcriptional regulator [Ignavibacteriae bacterium]|nr:winged helix-turn-helix transcriptional regulator [Ignavibacteriota bacterium]